MCEAGRLITQFLHLITCYNLIAPPALQLSWYQPALRWGGSGLCRDCKLCELFGGYATLLVFDCPKMLSFSAKIHTGVDCWTCELIV